MKEGLPKLLTHSPQNPAHCPGSTLCLNFSSISPTHRQDFLTDIGLDAVSPWNNPRAIPTPVQAVRPSNPSLVAQEEIALLQINLKIASGRHDWRLLSSRQAEPVNALEERGGLIGGSVPVEKTCRAAGLSRGQQVALRLTASIMKGSARSPSSGAACISRPLRSWQNVASKSFRKLRRFFCNAARAH